MQHVGYATELERKYEYLPHDDHGDDGLETGAGDEAEEGADGGLEGLRGSIAAVVEFEKEGSEERAEDHSDRGQDDAGDEAYESASFGILAAAGEFGEVHRHDVVDHRHYGHDHAPYQKHPDSDAFACTVSAVTPYVKDQEADPADRSARKSRKNTAGNTDDSGQYSDD